MPKYALHFRGHRKEWSFTVPADPAHVAEWRDDGLRVDEVVNEVPQIVQQLGLVNAWCQAQDDLKFVCEKLEKLTQKHFSSKQR